MALILLMFWKSQFIDIRFMKDPETEGIVMIGEIGGDAEEDVK